MLTAGGEQGVDAAAHRAFIDEMSQRPDGLPTVSAP